ncbi:hypothetical protein N656DRAFT_799854 [Canariomyces notabilis]|uniref:Ribonucleases P/MRP subunit Pop8-like domain-containing protein n=1 Tax=Canariomyces notabilis TaxID=2074819 RepID=A0AAN6QI87_9PEZI|nr:hypothetical protein N656DRAFT_799854 [Canariomyces arenarius]
MDVDTDPTTTTTIPIPITKPTNKPTKNRTLAQATLKNPPFAYAHLVVPPIPTPSSHPQTTTTLDNLQVRSYLTSALRQFLGDTGAGMSIDILLVRDGSAWVRVPRADLASFAAAVTAFPGLGSSSAGGGPLQLQLRACGDWLGSLLGRDEQGELWTS